MLLHLCRYLGMHLTEYRERRERQEWWARQKFFTWITSLQLCPIIWLIVVALMAVFIFHIMQVCQLFPC